ncbi:protein rep [Flavobacterium sp. D11R37]|uniref:protein rep n=1 Tax=Flavobacterium coralii TaxID=2838017 RepID=UPI001CA61993|nr:protein rep [Flavobacterium coralii]MBY8962047.1 protein rep [Flavobacterium coralii]
MAQFFDNQYFGSNRYKLAQPLDIDTDLVGGNGDKQSRIYPGNVMHPEDLSSVYKTLMHRMRNIAKTNYTLKEALDKRRPRIQFCGYVINGNTNNPISLCRSKSDSLFFNGVANCGGFWRCPVCALKISEAKKELLSGLIQQHQERGYSIGFLTLTIRHSFRIMLKASLDKLLRNYRSFMDNKPNRAFKKSLSFIGQVKTLEITYGSNGWHPHLHLLFFYKSDSLPAIRQFQRKFISSWAKYKDNNGKVSAQNQQVLTRDISDYVAKYDITSEMTKGSIKGSKGLTPFTALAKLALNNYETIEERNKLYGIYAHYVEATQGKHFVNISRELRKEYAEFLENHDKTDDEIVNNVEIDEILLKISVEVWRKIAKNDLQPLILNKFKHGGLDAVYSLLTYFRDFKTLEVEIDKNDYPLLTFSDYERTV